MARDPEAIYREERDGLLRFAYLLAGDRSVAEDAVADAVARAWPKLQRGRIDDPGRYLRRAIANRLIDHSRHRRIVRRVERQRVLPEGRSPESLAVDQALVVNIVRGLSSTQRAVVVCRFYCGMSLAETADTLGVSVGTVKSRMSRALANLREILAEDEGDANAVNA